MLEKNRFISFTDAILAVAATVMVLRLDIPDALTAEVIRTQGPTLLAYIISFAQIMLMWHEHHDTFVTVTVINHRIFLLNTTWIFLITLLPFVTGLIGKNHQDSNAMWLYIGILLAQQLVLILISYMVYKYTGDEIHDGPVIKRMRKIAVIVYILAAVIAYFSPFAALIIILLRCFVDIVMIIDFDRKMHI